MRCNNSDGYLPVFTTGADQDFDLAFHAANGRTARSCDVVAGYKDEEGQLKDNMLEKEKEKEKEVEIE